MEDNEKKRVFDESKFQEKILGIFKEERVFFEEEKKRIESDRKKLVQKFEEVVIDQISNR
jgi:hypothetical protein